MVNISSGIKQYPVKRLWQVVKTSIFLLDLEQTTTITTGYEQFVMFSEAACHVSNSRKLSNPKTIRTWSLAVLWLIKGRLLSLLQFYTGKVYGRRTRGLVYRSPLLTSLVQNAQAWPSIAKQNRKNTTLISTSLASTAGIADIISSSDFFLILDCRLFIVDGYLTKTKRLGRKSEVFWRKQPPLPIAFYEKCSSLNPPTLNLTNKRISKTHFLFCLKSRIVA